MQEHNTYDQQKVTYERKLQKGDLQKVNYKGKQIKRDVQEGNTAFPVKHALGACGPGAD